MGNSVELVYSHMFDSYQQVQVSAPRGTVVEINFKMIQLSLLVWWDVKFNGDRSGAKPHCLSDDWRKDSGCRGVMCISCIYAFLSTISIQTSFRLIKRFSYLAGWNQFCCIQWECCYRLWPLHGLYRGRRILQEKQQYQYHNVAALV